MKKISIALILVFFACLSMAQEKNVHSFTVTTLNGEEFDMAQLKGKKVLIVNTASKCGLTPQYEGLQELYEKYVDEDFVIVGFPANNFMNQEPGSDEEIKQFCQINYGVTFPMMSKISVKGDDIHPLYAYLTQKEENGKMNAKVSWNFQKFAIDENGNLVKMFPPKTKPMDEEIIAWIEG